MKTISRSVYAVTALAVLCGAMVQMALADGQQQPPSPQELLKALAEAGKPGAEHKKLQPFVGQWTFTMKLWTDPSQPPAELKGTIDRKWIMEGRFIQETARG